MSNLVKYQSYKSKGTSVTETSNCIGKGSTPDRKYVQEAMTLETKYLKDHKLENLPEIIQEIYYKGVLRKDQITLIKKLQQYIKVPMWKNRDLNKLNIGERNYLMNRYAHEYPNETKTFLKEYIPQNFPGIVDIQNLIQDLEKKINELSKQSLDFSLNSDPTPNFPFQFDFEYVDNNFDSFLNQEPDDSNDSFFMMK